MTRRGFSRARTLSSPASEKEPTALVGVIAQAKVETSATAMGKSLKSAAAVLGCLRNTKWDLFSAVAQLTDHRKTDADLLLADVRSWLKVDEHALAGGLAPKLSDAVDRAIRLLTPPKQPSVPPIPSVPKPGPQPTDPEWTVVLTDTKARMTENEVLGTAEELVRKLRENSRYRLTMQWTLEEGPP
jgi:hypothetical protein